MALEVFTNQGQTTVSSGGTTAPAAGTVETWTVTSSSSFPSLHQGATAFHVADANPALASEIIAVTNISGSTWTVTRGAENTSPVAHASGWTVVQVVTAADLQFFQYKPWQFPVEAYGAIGDAKVGTGGTGSNGSASFTDTGASFVNAAAPLGDVGKYIIVNQGTSGAGTSQGTAQNPFVGTILSVNSATNVTLSGNLSAATASAPYVYGTDAVPGIQAAINAAYAYGTANGEMAEVVLRPDRYMLGTLTQTTAGGLDYNTHLSIPSPGQNAQRFALRIKGVGIPYNPYWEEETVQLSGTCLISGVFPPNQPDLTFGQMSVIGSTTNQPGATAFNNTVLSVDEVSIVVPWNSQIYGVDGRYIDQLEVPRGLCKAFAPVNVPGASLGGPYLQRIPTNGVSIGYAFPIVNNNDVSHSLWLCALAMSNGVALSEHAQISKLTTLYCNNGVSLENPGGTIKHGITIHHMSAEGCTNCIDTSNAIASSLTPFNIGLLDGETNVTTHINDPNNVMTGIVYWADESASTVTVVGGANLIVIDTAKHFPGPWSGAPAAPASGTAQQNLAYRYATIYASATTSITSFAVGPTSGSMTTRTISVGANVVFPIRVPPGWFWKATYSGTLTAAWTLD